MARKPIPNPTNPIVQRGHSPVTPLPGYTHPIQVGPPPSGRPTTTTPPPLSTAQQSAYDIMKQYLHEWGLDSLSNDLRNLIVKGSTTRDDLTFHLSQTDAYKKRFAANDERIKNGLQALLPKEYMDMEAGYKAVLRHYQLPGGFYDKPDDFNKWIAGNVSAAEIETRAQIAEQQYINAPPQMRSLWKSWFGTKGDALAAILDPDVATSVIQNRGTQIALGGAAAQNGLQISQSRAQQLQEGGAAAANAQGGYGKIGQVLGTDSGIAKRFGTDFTQKDEEDDIFLASAEAANKRQLIYNQEKGLFDGSSGADSNSLGVSQSY